MKIHRFMRGFLKKLTVLSTIIGLLFQSFIPAVLLAYPAPVVAIETVNTPSVSLQYDGGTHTFALDVLNVSKTSYTLTYQRDGGVTEAVEGNVDALSGVVHVSLYAGTCSTNGICVPHDLQNGTLHVDALYGDTQSYVYDENFSINNGVFWTEHNRVYATPKVELNKTYVAPQNGGVKLTFTKLPSPAGNINIEEITLTKEQIEQTGSLSEKAYDITSDMADGSFSYNLSLPIPESSKGQEVEVKFAEELSKIGSAEKVGNAVTNTDTSVSVASLDHFTIFVVSNPSPPPTNHLQDIVDNSDAGFEIVSGTWRTSTSVSGYYGSNYATTDNHAGVGAVRWNFTPTQSGTQEIFARWTAAANRGTAVPFTVTHDGGSTTVPVNEELNNGTWMSLGTYSFTAGNPYSVTLTNNSTNASDFVVGDAVKLQNVSDPTEVWVDDSWAGTSTGADLGSGKIFGYSAFSTIQAGIAGVAAGGTMNVAAGTYTEAGQIVINKNLSIVGADKTTTIIKPAQNTGSGNHQDANTWVLVNSGITFNLSNVTLDASGKLINHGILSHGHGTIDNNIFTNITYNQSGPDYKGIGIELYGSDMTVRNNNFSNIGRIGVYMGFGSIATITDNTYTGKGSGNFLDYAFEVGRNGYATISNNTISDNKGVASSDGSTSAGILVTSYFNPETPSQANITGNIITNSTYGIAVGYADGDATSIPQLDTNTFSDNTYDVDNHAVNNIDARNNIWSVTDQNSLDQIEAKINHYCSGSTYVHGTCNVTGDYGVGFGMVQYKDIGIPNNLGWNIRSKSSMPNEAPLDVTCSGYTNENSVAQNWSAVNGVNIKYQRKVTFPSNAISSFEAGSNTYTPFSTFGSVTGIEGLWKTRVRAYVDANNSNTYNSGEEVSDWSNECNITFDKTTPTVSGTPTPDVSNPTASTVITWVWTAATDTMSGVKQYLWELWNSTVQVLSGTTTGTSISTSGLTDEAYTMKVTTEDNAGNQSGQVLSSSVIVDTTNPNTPTFVSSGHTPSVWSSDRTIDISWTATDPAPGSGIGGYSYRWSTNSTTVPDMISEGTNTTTTSSNRATSQSIYFHVRAKDVLGHWGPTLHYGPFWVDANAPTGSWVTPLNTAHLRSTVNLEVSPNDVGSGVQDVVFKIKRTGGSFTTISTDTTNPYQGSLDTTTKTDGTYVLRAQIFDNVNRSVNKDITVTIDNTAPVISAVNLANITTSNDTYVKNGDSVVLTATITDTNQTNITPSMITADLTELGGGATDNPVSYNSSTGLATWAAQTVSGTADSLVTVSVNANDFAGNSATADTDTIQADNTKPSSTISSPTNNGTNSIIYTNSWDGSIGGTATDALSGVSGVKVSIKNAADEYFDGGTFVAGGEILLDATYAAGDWGYTGLTSPADDSYTIKSHAIDTAGNVEDTYTLTIILDKTIPEILLSINPSTADASNGWYKTQPEVTLTATDVNIDKIEYQWDSQTGPWTIYSAPFKPGSEGAHVLYYRAHDLADNYSEVGVKNIKWDTTELTDGPLNLSISPNPTGGSTATVKWDAAKDNVGISKYEVQWTLNGSSTGYTDTVGSDIREHGINNLTEGTWTVRVRAFDDAGHNKDATINEVVDRTAPAAPILSLTGTGTGTASLAWNTVADATDYIIWYGVTTGTYIYGARVGNVSSYTVQGLGAGSYFFVVRAVDASNNQSANSNEVSTGTIAGAPGVQPGAPAQGFAPEVLGQTTTEEATPSSSPTQQGLVEGAQTNDWEWLWWLLLTLPVGGALYFLLRRRVI